MAATASAVLRTGGLSDRTVVLGIDRLILYVSASAFEDGLFEHSGMSTQEIAEYFDDVHAFYACSRLSASRSLRQSARSWPGTTETSASSSASTCWSQDLEAVDRERR